MGNCFSSRDDPAATSNNQREINPTKATESSNEKNGKANATKMDKDGTGDTATKKTALDFGYRKDFKDAFELGRELGRGQFGITYEATDIDSGKVFAAKVLNKGNMKSRQAIEDVKREIDIMIKLRSNDHVVYLFDSFEDSFHVYMVMECCTGGELFDRIIARGHYSEKDAAILLRQMLTMVAECHLQGIIHRDLKPENFLFLSKDENSPLKATDYGLSAYFSPGQAFTDVVGSAYYVAPEVLRRNYGQEADVWSIGVIMYILLCGQPPFWAPTEMGIFKEILAAKVDLSRPPWNKISKSAVDLLKKILNPDVKARLTASQCLSHPWMRGGAPDVPLDISVLTEVRNFAKFGRFKRLALKAIAKTLSTEEIRDLRDQFVQIDKDRNGFISLDEMRQAMAKMQGSGITEDKLREIVKSIDSNADGQIDIGEFIAATLHVHQLQRQDGNSQWSQRTYQAFNVLDVDGNGYITVDELRSLMGGEDDTTLEQAIKEADSDGDGQISYREFCELLKKNNLRLGSLPQRR